MRPVNDPFSSLPSVLLNIIGIVSLFGITCTSTDDSGLQNVELLKSIEGVEDGTTDFLNPQSNATALELLRKSAEFKKFFHTDGSMIYSNVTKNDNVFAFLLPVMNSEAQLTVVFTPCGSLPVTWRLLHRPPNEQSANNGVFSVAVEDEQLYNFSGVEPSMFHRQGAPGGLYLVQVLSKNDTSVQIHASTAKGGQAVVNISSFNITTRIRVEKRFDVNPPVARLLLPELNVEFEQFYLVFVISRRKFYHSLCHVMSSHPERSNYVDEAVPCYNLQNDSELQVCRADGHRSLVDLQLETNHLYYISVFAWDSNGLSVQYSNVTFKFKRFPVRLRDGIPQIVNITTNGGKFSFKYKVRKNNTGINSPLLFYVFPCAGMGSITVETKQKKSIVLQARISEYKKFEIANPLADPRYIIVIRSEVPKAVRGCDLVEVMATVRPNAFPLPPIYPSDTRINVTMPITCAANKSAKNDVSPAYISWFPIITNETLEYCVLVKVIPANETGNVLTTTSLFYPQLKKLKRNQVCVPPFPDWKKPQPYSIEVKGVKPRVNYTVQVIVKKPNQSERFLPYEILTGVHSDC